jgi:hypothetical protein
MLEWPSQTWTWRRGTPAMASLARIEGVDGAVLERMRERLIVSLPDTDGLNA